MTGMTPEDSHRTERAESDVSIVLGTASIVTLVLAQIVGAETHLELLLLLAVVAALASRSSRRSRARRGAGPLRSRRRCR